MSRAYCRDDKPFPVSAKAMRTLADIAADNDAEEGFLISFAHAQVERLRRSGYVITEGELAYITDAGRALLAGTLRVMGRAP